MWILSFECGGVVKVGGLGEAVRGYAAHLAQRGHEVKVLMPSHGLRGSGLEKLGEVEVSRIELGRVEVLLVGGSVLSSGPVYSNGLTEEKAAALARAAGKLAERFGEPDVVHANDWHSVPPALALLAAAGGRPAFVFHVHLHMGKRVGWDYLFAACGLDPGWKLRGVWLGEAYNRAGGALEAIAAQIADRVVTVSRSYMEEVIAPAVGWAAGDRLRYVHNGTDWSVELLYRQVEELHGEELRRRYGTARPSRRLLREYLLTEALRTANPRILDPELRWAARPVEPFPSNGPLVLATGRASWQKGLDVLLRASELLAEIVPNLRVLILAIPVRGEEQHLGWLIGEAERIGCARLVVGHAHRIYALAHLAANAFAVPSRWEPFGLTAIEAMAAGVPVAASGVGGLKETVLDLRADPARGTGYLVRPDDPRELARALAALLAATARSELERAGAFERVAGFALEAASLEGRDIRENCIARVEEHFRWWRAAERMERVYEEALARAHRLR